MEVKKQREGLKILKDLSSISKNINGVLLIL